MAEKEQALEVEGVVTQALATTSMRLLGLVQAMGVWMYSKYRRWRRAPTM